jgi:hypothetical protein
MQISIYTISDPFTNEVRYIGQSKDLKSRIRKHINESKNTKKHLYAWIKSILNNGNKPLFEEIEKVDDEIADIVESMYISLFKSWGFKLLNLSDGGQTNRYISLETRKKISDSLKVKIQSEETKQKRIASLKQIYENAELRELKRNQTIDLINRGVINQKGKVSKKKGLPFQGDKNKISESLKVYWSDEYRKLNESIKKGGKKINVFKLLSIVKGNRFKNGSVEKGEFVECFINKADFCRRFNIERNHINRCLNGNLKQIKGYIFEYENN